MSDGSVGISVSISGGMVGKPSVGGNEVCPGTGVKVGVGVPVAVAVGWSSSVGGGDSVGTGVSSAGGCSAGASVGGIAVASGADVTVGIVVGVPAPHARVAATVKMSKIARYLISSLCLLWALSPGALL